jgi:hypothetical protein
VLFFHGEKDAWLSPDHSRELLKFAPPGSELTLAPLDNHVTLPLQLERLARAVLEWFDVNLHPCSGCNIVEESSRIKWMGDDLANPARH